MVSFEFKGHRFVAIRNRLESSPNWRTPTDFLGDYIKIIMGGAGWGNLEISKPYPDRHPILQWYHDLCLFQRRPQHTRGPDGLFSGVATGSVKAYYALAYDLWTLDNHDLLQGRLINRLKCPDQFQGARYELYVIAALIRAGFNVELEDESDGNRSHCELTATHRRTARKFSVEAKSTGRSGMLGKPGPRPGPDEIRAKIYGKLQKALLKQADHDRIVFIDVNMPPHKGMPIEAGWIYEITNQMEKIEENQSADDPFPPAFLFFTNHPYHYVGNDNVEPGQTALFTGINIRDLKAKNSSAGLPPRFETDNSEILQLVDSVFNHTTIPTRF